MSPANIVMLLVLAAIWGTSFMLMRITAPVFGPMFVTLCRAGLAAVALLLLVRARGITMHWRRNLVPYVVIGLTNTALPFALFAWSALHIPSAYMATMNSLAPVFTALFGLLLLGERLSATRMAAFVLGLAGVGVLVGIGPMQVDGLVIAAVLASMGAAVSYGFAATFTRMRAGGIAPLAMAAGSQCAAAILLLPLALPDAAHALAVGSVGTWSATIVLGLGCTALAYALFFQLIAAEGASKAITVTFLIPVFAALWAWLVLDEAITTGTIIGIAVVLIATATALRAKPGVRRPAASST